MPSRFNYLPEKEKKNQFPVTKWQQKRRRSQVSAALPEGWWDSRLFSVDPGLFACAPLSGLLCFQGENLLELRGNPHSCGLPSRASALLFWLADEQESPLSAQWNGLFRTRLTKPLVLVIEEWHLLMNNWDISKCFNKIVQTTSKITMSENHRMMEWVSPERACRSYPRFAWYPCFFSSR